MSPRLERPGSLHLALRVDDAAAVHERLSAAGYLPLSAPQTLPDDGTDWSGCVVFYVRDPDGVTIEIVERAERPAAVPAVPVSDVVRAGG